MKAIHNLRLIGLALALVVVAGTTGFHFIEGWSWFDGFYMVVTTLTTIGYQETHPLSHAGRVFNVCVIVAGVSLVFLAIGALTQALLEFELRSFFGRRKMEREIGRLNDHYIICGAGRVGRSAARELARRPVPFVIIENNEAKAARYNSEDWLVLIGDATKEQTLREAHIEQARGLVAATTTDATNLYIILTARALESEAENHCARQRRGCGEASADGGRRLGRFALLFCRAAHRADLSAPARREFSGHRHHPSGHRPRDRRNLRGPALQLCGQDDRDFAHPAGTWRHRAGHQARARACASIPRPTIASKPETS